jgi:two-component system sensor histidine kinase/response regulator
MNESLRPQPDVASSATLANWGEVQAVFIRNVHHELRTPVGVIHGYTQLLNMGTLGELTPEQRHVLSIMDNRLYDLQAIIERIEVLMTVAARATVGMPLSPLELLRSIVERLKSAAEEANLTFEFDAASDLPLVGGDAKALTVALESLIENAIKFTPAGGRVTVHLFSVPDWVCFEIADTGIGLTPNELTQVIEGFRQADTADSRRYNGLGLGLAVVKAVVNSHGGQLQITSERGRGSQFVLHLPSLSPQTRGLLQPEASPSQAVPPRRILLVDDELNQVSILKSGLAKLPNCEIAVATNGRQALALFAEQPYDLMITDYRMPEMDGLALASLIREQYPATHIILLTAFGSEVLHETAGANPAQLVLEKPIDIRHIREAALNALDSQL